MAEQLRAVMLRQSKEGIVAALHAMAARPDMTANLGNIQVPTLIISGAEDAIIPGGEAEEMASRISGAKRVSIESAGHMPMMEAPEHFNEALAQFLRAARQS